MLIREGNSWISYVNDSESDISGYLIYPHCPYDYCLPPYPNVKISLNDVDGADVQCANKRSGILCSVCQNQQNLSLSLGNSHCIYCSDSWYLQMIAVAIGVLLAGIFLVAILMLLNLTVAIGTLNGLIFYANIVGASNYTLLTGSSSATKLLTILTSWINLDINIEFDICFQRNGHLLENLAKNGFSYVCHISCGHGNCCKQILNEIFSADFKKKSCGYSSYSDPTLLYNAPA